MDDIAETADLRGLRCPLPALKTRARLKRLELGQRLEVLADDPLAGIDIPAFCNESGNRLVVQEALDGDVQRFVVERVV